MTHPYQQRYANHPWPNSRPRLFITGLVTILVSGFTSYSLATSSLSDQLRTGWIAVALAGVVSASLWMEARRRGGKNRTRWGGPTRPRHWQRSEVVVPIRIRRGHNCHLGPEPELDESTFRPRVQSRTDERLEPSPRDVGSAAALKPAESPLIPEVETPLFYRPEAGPRFDIAPCHTEDQRAEEPSPVKTAPSSPDAATTVRRRRQELTPIDQPAGSLVFQPFQPNREQPSPQASSRL